MFIHVLMMEVSDLKDLQLIALVIYLKMQLIILHLFVDQRS